MGDAVSAALEARAEIVKLARLLRSDRESLAFLAKAPPADLRRFREQAMDALFEADRRKLERVAAASRRLPAALVARIGQRVYGALLSARVAGMLEPRRAVDVARRLSPAFLADVAAEMDPRRASDVLARMPATQVADVARELVRREDFVTMGRFVAHLSDEALTAALEATDDAALLRIAFVMDEKDRLDHVIELCAEDRLAGMVSAAAAEDLWAEALDLLTHVRPERRERLARVELPARQRARAAAQARELGLLDELGPLGA